MTALDMRDAVVALARFLNSGGAGAGMLLGPASGELIWVDDDDGGGEKETVRLEFLSRFFFPPFLRFHRRSNNLLLSTLDTGQAVHTYQPGVGYNVGKGRGYHCTSESCNRRVYH